MKTTTHYCDVCKAVLPYSFEKDFNKKIPVIFTTEQTEGRSVEAYFQYEEIDICKECEKRALSGEAIFASGAQGYNTYQFKISQEPEQS